MAARAAVIAPRRIAAAELRLAGALVRKLLAGVENRLGDLRGDVAELVRR